MDLLSKLQGNHKDAPIEPREIFMSLPKKKEKYEYPRDVQTDVWESWFEKKDNKNNIIKMNTGSGKTVVELIILKSCLNEGKGPAVYVVPDKYLLKQVINEANDLGINVTDDRNNYHFSENKAILVTTIHKLINGKSVFGMRDTMNYPIESIIIDDIHACIETITRQFSLKIPKTHELYGELINLFTNSWKNYDSYSFKDIVIQEDPLKSMLLPFWIWQKKHEDVREVLKKYETDEKDNQFIYFNLPLIEDEIKLSNCTITSKFIEIKPKGTLISKISSFQKASRKIFMSATLSDDSVFVSSMGLKKDEVETVITPDKANDIGNRLVLFPKHLNSQISEEEIRQKVISLSTEYNIAVIVPSREQGLKWDETGEKLVMKENIEEVVRELRKEHKGLVVFVNRYDGIDLPGDACRLLVIDGLPPLNSEYDKYIQGINPKSNYLLRGQVQRIEQGMGRGVRSSSDSCSVILMGNKLADVLVRGKGISYFSNTTKEQYNLSKELWDLLKNEYENPTIDQIFELADYSLKRNPEWITKSKERLSEIEYEKSLNIDTTSVVLREAFDLALTGQYQEAASLIDEVINSEESDRTKGYLLQIKAGYINLFDESAAQQILITAKKLNSGTLIPIEGMQYSKKINNREQSRRILDYTQQFDSDPNEYIIHIKALFDDLVYPSKSKKFEIALEKIGKLLGFNSSRPEIETSGAGPDNLWALGDGEYLIIECKNEATTDTISKDYCNQLAGSVRWFNNQYNNEFNHTPIMIHNSDRVNELATAVTGMRVLTTGSLNKFKDNIDNFATSLVQNKNWDNEAQIESLLQAYKLRNIDIVREYTEDIIEE